MMRSSTIRDLIILLIIGGAIWAFFTFVPVFSWLKKPEVTISVETEEKIGELIMKGMEQDGSTSWVHNPTIDSAMMMITSRLLKSVDTVEYEYKFRVVQSDDINAFTLPGGNIVVFTGLLEFADSPEEVAAVLAHEIGHAQKRHVVKKIIKELGISIITTVLMGGDNVLIGEIGRTAASTVFDREQEREADDYGLKLMEHAGIEPKSMAVFFRKLNEKGGTYNENLEILMTHPHNNSRIKNALEYKTDTTFKKTPFDQINWQRVKQQSASLGLSQGER